MPARMARVRYIIIGAGAVGGTIGGCLFQAGHDVILVARGAHLEALRARGLRLATPLGTSTLDIPAVGGPAEVGLRPGDTLILTAKTQDAAVLMDEWAWQPVSEGTVVADTLPVVCAQNGVASERFALRRFRHVYGMHVWLPATHLEPGEVEAQGVPLAGLLHIGRYPSGTDATSAAIAHDLGNSRFIAPASENVMRWKYGKLLDNLNNAIEALCVRDASGFGAGADTGAAAALRRLVRDEGTTVLDIAGFDYSSAAELADVRRDSIRIEPVNGSARAGGSSWQSLTRQTGTIEANFLNGEIVLLGRQYDVPTPVNEALQRLANQASRQRTPPGSMTPAQVLAAAGVAEAPGDTPVRSG
jgi:2-dehydropantoate 2-reductase